jgi:hypothetical protein
MSIERRIHHRTPRPTVDDLLAEALGHAELAYQFAPNAHTFAALTAIKNAFERLSTGAERPTFSEEYLKARGWKVPSSKGEGIAVVPVGSDSVNQQEEN